MIEQTFAGVAFVVCALLLARLCVGERRRRRLDAIVLRGFATGRHRAARLWRWHAARREARRVAEEAIRRARDKRDDEGAWNGNVSKTKPFRRPRKPH